MVHPQIWQDVPYEQICHAVIRPNPEKGAQGDEESYVAKENKFGVLRLIERTGRVEMVDAGAKSVLLSFPTTFALPLVEVMPPNISQEVSRPATKLLTNEVEGCGNGCLLGKFVNLVHDFSKVRSVLLPG